MRLSVVLISFFDHFTDMIAYLVGDVIAHHFVKDSVLSLVLTVSFKNRTFSIVSKVLPYLILVRPQQ